MSWDFIKDVIESLTLIGILWTAWETFKLRKSAQAQEKLQLRPVLSFVPVYPPYVIKNETNNVALNIFCFSKRRDGYYVVPNSSHVIGILGSKSDTGNNYQTNGFSAEQIISRKEFLKKFDWIEPLLKKIEEEDILTRFVICYEDAFGNKLFTFINSSGGSYASTCETGYISDLE